jgi:Family of unknown function (DUF5946)
MNGQGPAGRPTVVVVVTCGCGAVVPAEDGPVHAYMEAKPACWRSYGELMVRILGLGPGDWQATHVDCYAASHPGGAELDRRQRASVAVHLVALCLRLEQNVRPGQLIELRGETTRLVLPALGWTDWPFLAPPASFGELTAPGLVGIPDSELPAALDKWSTSVWDAWADHHEVVRQWAAVLKERRWGR